MFQKIFPNLFAFISQNQGSNVFLITDEKNTLIDSSLSINLSALQDSLKALSLSLSDIDLILHTHGHADHFSCSKFFPNAKLFMHKHDALHVNAQDDKFTYAHFFSENNYPKIDAYFDEHVVIELGKFLLKVFFTPGHTAGSVCFFEEKKKLLFSGDTLFNNSFGRTDLNSSSSIQLKDSLQKLSTINFTYLLPGHNSLLFGEEENKSNLRRLLAFL